MFILDHRFINNNLEKVKREGAPKNADFFSIGDWWQMLEPSGRNWELNRSVHWFSGEPSTIMCDVVMENIIVG